MAVSDPALQELDIFDSLSVVDVADVDVAVGCLEEGGIAKLCPAGL